MRRSTSLTFNPKQREGSLLKFAMAFLHRRFFSSTAYRQKISEENRFRFYETARPTIATPAPTSGGAVLSSPELQQLATKAKGPWKDITKEEAVKCKYEPELKEMHVYSK